MPLLAPLTQLSWPATLQHCGRISREHVQREPIEATARHGVKACNHGSPGGSTSATSARDIAGRLAALLAFALVGCATPVLQPSVDVPGRFAAAPAIDSDPRPPGGTATAIRSYPISFAAPRARTATSRSPRNACVRRDPARRSAAHGCIRASAFMVPASITEPDTARRPSRPFRRPRTQRAGKAASMFPGKSTSPGDCARAPLRLPPTRARPNTRRAAFVFWWSRTLRRTISCWSARCANSTRCVRSRLRRTKRCAS